MGILRLKGFEINPKYGNQLLMKIESVCNLIEASCTSHINYPMDWVSIITFSCELERTSLRKPEI